MATPWGAMALIKPSEPWAMTAEQSARRSGWAARSELALRNAIEALLRTRRPGARLCHEMVMGEGRVRADVVAIDTDHITAVEVKGEHDDTTRLLHQVGMYQLCVPEVWMVCYEKHAGDAVLIRHLLPSVGLATHPELKHSWHRIDDEDKPLPEVTLSVVAEPEPRPPVTECMLEMLWRDELEQACNLLRVSIGKRATRPVMMKALRHACSHDELFKTACQVLRGRDALWRADAPVKAVPA